MVGVATVVAELEVVPRVAFAAGAEELLASWMALAAAQLALGEAEGAKQEKEHAVVVQ